MSLQLQLQENNYESIRFLIGVDSAINTAGAQSGALDYQIAQSYFTILKW